MIKFIKKLYGKICVYFIILYKKFEIYNNFNSIKEYKNITEIGNILFIKDLISLDLFLRVSSDRKKYSVVDSNDYVIVKNIFKLINEIECLYKTVGV